MYQGVDSTVSTQDVNFAAYNILECRVQKIASFPLNEANSKKGLVAAMDLYPIAGGPTVQTIFSIRNTDTKYLSLQFFFTSDGLFNIWTNPPSGPYYVFAGNEKGYSGLSSLTFGTNPTFMILISGCFISY